METQEHRVTIYKSLFWMLFLVGFCSVIGSRLYVNQLNADHANIVYNLADKLGKLETENAQLIKVRKQCFEERQQQRRGTAVKQR